MHLLSTWWKLLLTFLVCLGNMHDQKLNTKKFKHHKNTVIRSGHLILRRFLFDSYLLNKYYIVVFLLIEILILLLHSSVASAILFAHHTKMLTKVHPHYDKSNSSSNSEQTAKQHANDTYTISRCWFVSNSNALNWNNALCFACLRSRAVICEYRQQIDWLNLISNASAQLVEIDCARDLAEIKLIRGRAGEKEEREKKKTCIRLGG